jgi:hypothetical protein
MGLLDEIRRELQNALEEAQRQAEAGAPGAARPAPPGPVPPRPSQGASVGAPRPPVDWPKPGRKIANAAQTAARSTATAPQRVDGRLQRERLERPNAAPAGVPARSDEPTTEDFRRKVESMQAEEPVALGALDAFDLGLETAAPGGAGAPPVVGDLTFSPRDVLRAFVLGEIIDEPRSRRAAPPRRRS